MTWLGTDEYMAVIFKPIIGKMMKDQLKHLTLE